MLLCAPKMDRYAKFTFELVLFFFSSSVHLTMIRLKIELDVQINHSVLAIIEWIDANGWRTDENSNTHSIQSTAYSQMQWLQRTPVNERSHT